MTDSKARSGASSAPAPNLLFPHCKIVSSYKGFLKFNEDNLNKIVKECLSTHSLPKDIPASALAIIGPPSSGKSFLTNLLIQYYKCGGDGEWLQRLTKINEAGEQVKVPGFAFDSVQLSSPSLFRPNEEDQSSSGIYLWPQPFIMELYGGKHVIWIFHLCVGEDSTEEDIQTLEKFLLLACSRLAEINVGDEDFRILRGKSTLELAQQPIGKVCNSVVFIFRSKNALAKPKSRSTTDSEAKQELVMMISSFRNSELDPSTLDLDTLHHINIVRISDSPDPLHNPEGCLNPKLDRNVRTALRNLVAIITDDSEILPQKGENGKVVSLAGFPQFIKSCVNSVNLVTGHKCPVIPVTKPRTLTKSSNTRPALPIASSLDFTEPSGETQNDIISDDDPRRAEMIQKAFESIHKFQSMAYSTAEQWLVTQLTLTNISKVSKMHDPLLARIRDEGHAQVDGRLWLEMDQILDEEYDNHCSTYLSKVQTHLETFLQGMTKQFHLHYYFHPEELGKVGKELIPSPKKFQELDSNTEIGKLVQIGFEKLMEQFREKNDEIHNDETILASTLIPEVIQFYNDEMSTILMENIYPRHELKMIHESLVAKLVEAFRTAFRLSDGVAKISENVENKIIILESVLQDEFTAHSKGNAERLKKMLGDLGKCMKEAKSSYVEKIEEFLEQHPNGVNNEDLRGKHDDVLKDVKKMLEVKIRENLGNQEPLEMHMKSIEVQAEAYFKSVEEANNDNLLKVGDGPIEEIEVELEPQEILGSMPRANVDQPGQLGQGTNDEDEVNPVMQELMETIPDSDITDAPTEGGDDEDEVISNPHEFTRTLTSENVEESGPPQEPIVTANRILPPLIFQLQLKSIKMGIFINNTLQILKNDMGHDTTPLVAGLSKDGELWYGGQVLEDIEESEVTNHSNLERYWQLGRKFTSSGDEPWRDVVELGTGETKEVTLESLLALNFKALKDHAEAELHGSCMAAVITVPFCMDTQQRGQIMDGGKMAGFSQIHIYEETFAAALSFTSNETGLSANEHVLVLSEYDNKIDASIYGYASRGQGSLSLASRCGNYYGPEILTDVEKVRVKANEDAIIDQMEKDVDGKEDSEDERIEILTKVCKDVHEWLKKADGTKHDFSTNKLHVISESEVWKEILVLVGRDFSTKVRDIVDDNPVILGAALMAPSQICYEENPVSIAAENVDGRVWV